MGVVISMTLIFARFREAHFYLVFTQTTRDANFVKNIQENEPGNGTFLIDFKKGKFQKILKI